VSQTPQIELSGSPPGGVPVSRDFRSSILIPLHRADFGLKEAPASPCILYASSCRLSERDLVDHFGLLVKGKAAGAAPDERSRPVS